MKKITNINDFFKQLSMRPINVLECGTKLSRSKDITIAHDAGWIRYEKRNEETFIVRTV